MNLNDKINKLTLLSYVERPAHVKHKDRYGLFQCACGNKKVIALKLVTNHHTKSCGCLQLEKLKISQGKNKLSFGISSQNLAFYQLKKGAEKRGLAVSLTKEDFLLLSQKSCSYCGGSPKSKLSHSHMHGFFIYNGIDRIDNSKGYHLENCTTCCIICNRMKSAYALDFFLDHISKIYENKCK